MSNEKTANLWGNYLKIYGVALIVLIVTNSLAFEGKAEVLVAIIRAILSVVVMISPILVIGPMLAAKRFVTFLAVITGLIILSGVLAFKLWPIESDLDIFVIIPLIPLSVIFLRNIFRLMKYTDGSKNDAITSLMGLVKINSAIELIVYCLKIKPFGELLIMEFGILLFGAFAHTLALMYGDGNLPGVYMLFVYLICLIVFSAVNLFGALHVTKKVKKPTSAIISLLIITLIAVPSLIIYFLFLLSISEKLMGRQ